MFYKTLHRKLRSIKTKNVCITKYARLYKLSNGIMVIQSNNLLSEIIFIVTVTLTFKLMTPR